MVAVVALSAGGLQAENSGFVYRLKTQFMLDGRPVFFSGSNSYYQVTYRRWNAPGPDEVLNKMAARRMTLVRTWAFQDAGRGRGLPAVCPPAQAGGRRTPGRLS